MRISSLSPKDIPALMPQRSARSNKGTFGRVLVACGSRGMSGAAYLCALAAYRSGCGLVEILTAEENRIILQTLLPEAVVTCYDSSLPNPDIITAAISRADAVAVGCGLGESKAAATLLENLLTDARVPLVIDADALNIISKEPRLFSFIQAPTIITPHPAEMSRISGHEVSAILGSPTNTAAAFALKRGVICILKDHNTVTSDGSHTFINKTGNSGMATGGSGDVLTGIIASLLAQYKFKIPPLVEVGALGVLIHGMAGDAAATKLGEYSMIASDIIAQLPSVLNRKHRR